MKRRSRAIGRVTRTSNVQVSIVIVQFNNPHLTEQCLQSLLTLQCLPIEIILVDNNSTDPNARGLGRKFRNIRFVQNDSNMGFGGGNNKGASYARGNILLFLNNDTVACEDFITPVKKIFDADPDVGIVGPRLLNGDRSLQLSFGRSLSFVNEARDKWLYRMYERGNAGARRRAQELYSEIRQVDWLTGAALFIRRRLFENLGGFDEEFFMFFEDKDLCLRAHLLGTKVVYAPAGCVVHLRGASANNATNAIYRASQIRYYQKHRNLIEQMLLKCYLIIGRKLNHA